MWATCFWPGDGEVQRQQGPGMQSGREVGRRRERESGEGLDDEKTSSTSEAH